MKPTTRRRLNSAIAAAALFCMTTQSTFAALLNLAQAPLFIGANVPPKVMLTISKDQQLYKKAYNDYSDLDGDTKIETTYKHSISYYGYFDPTKCYLYSTSNGRFEPQSITVDTKGDAIPALCTNQWSGNFLNWISMTRMDAVRKLLYGGFRSTDSATDTVLERAFVPTDAHAWAKYYNPDPADTNQPDINKLTPFNPPITPPTTARITTAFTIPLIGGDFPIVFATLPTGFTVGDQLRMTTATGSVTGPVMSISGNIVTLRLNPAGITGGGTIATAWNVTNLSAAGISFCNMTKATGASQSTTAPPLIRVANGNFGLWNANERWQCQWFEEQNNLQSGFGGVRSNGNQSALSEIAASAENPSQTSHGLGTGSAKGEYIARVQACVSVALTGKEKCQQYPSGNYKPIGLLQVYGDDQRIHFGLMTGSYTKNISGGVLRKNAGSFADEVLVSTNGRFNTAVNGIVKTLNSMRIYGYNYGDGTYLGSSGDNCTFQLTDITEGSCTSWGNPMSEIYFEALRYFAGKTATPAYQYTTSGSKDAALSLPGPAVWTDPISPATYCAPLNILMFNASVSTNDDDLRTTSAAAINSTRTVGNLTTTLGDAEGITNGKYFAGKILGVTGVADPGFELCTSKTITALSDVSGICPEGPTLSGSYLMAGLAHHARTNRIRTDLNTVVPIANTTALKVTTYGIQLATNTPKLEIPIPGKKGENIVIQPIYRLDLGTSFGGGALVDLKYVRTATDMSSGKVYINWEDSEQGGDYDQDMWGTLEWRFVGNTIEITTNAVSASTANPQGFGYTISGTDRDGAHFHSGILGFNFVDPTGAMGCANCQVSSSATGQRGPQAVSYTLAPTTTASLKDPMWYMAKYGGFIDSNGDNLPNLPNEWDQLNNLTAATGADGDPDNYFLVTNPLGLEKALSRALDSILDLTSASSVAANSTSLKTGSAIYAARFDAKDWSGRFAARLLLDDGTVKTSAEWDADTKLPSANSRQILTYNDDPNPAVATSRKGVAFRWTDISAAQKAALNTIPETPTLLDTRGQDRLDYLRGDASKEGATTSSFRRRPVTKLGDITNSSPAYVPGVPNDAIRDSSYKAFRDKFVKTPRQPMVYVGANDGMLHGFDATADATGGVEKIAYVPSKIYKNLSQLTSQTYRHRYYVDGTPTAADAQVAGQWTTVLVGALGGGGQSLYALDVTDPASFGEKNTKTVMWEFSDTDDVISTDPANPGGLGYVFGQPVIRKMSNGKWAAIVSGGYNNFEVDGALPSAPATKSSAYLYIIFLDGPSGGTNGRTWVHGTDYIRLDTNVGTSTTPNGLAQPFAADVNSDGFVDYLYAGDLRGNFWKFDVSGSSSGQPPGPGRDPKLWLDMTKNRVKLFAGTQPITSAAEGIVHPTGQGFIIMFGTGKYLEPTDAVPAYQTQSFYGIWDKNDSPTDISKQTKVTSGSSFFQQVITTDGTYRTLGPAPTETGTAPDWKKDLGWSFDFPNSATTGERVVFDPVLVAGRLVFTTLLPSGGACEFGGTSFLMVVNPVTGGRFESAVLDVNGDGKITSADTLKSGLYASGVQSAVGITPTPTIIGGRNLEASGSATVAADGSARVRNRSSRRGNMIFGGSSQQGQTVTLPIGLDKSYGRVSWHEVLK